jgi:hypothetical protein
MYNHELQKLVQLKKIIPRHNKTIGKMAMKFEFNVSDEHTVLHLQNFTINMMEALCSSETSESVHHNMASHPEEKTRKSLAYKNLKSSFLEKYEDGEERIEENGNKRRKKERRKGSRNRRRRV